jgi:leucyl/phenylalanyl-tRNA---protein transferase
VHFPDPGEHDFPDWVPFGGYLYYGPDVVALGVELSVATLSEAYAKGIFPWHMDGVPLPWCCPARRAILDFADLRIPASLARARRRSGLRFTIDEDFRHVMEECALARRPGQKGTWITAAFIERYTELHEAGGAHSVEAWDGAGNLVGGVYGVDAGGVFCGESMFFTRPNASKLSLLFLIEHLASRGSTWLDIQVMTPHMQSLGAKEIDRREFLARLKNDTAAARELFPAR